MDYQATCFGFIPNVMKRRQSTKKIPSSPARLSWPTIPGIHGTELCDNNLQTSAILHVERKRSAGSEKLLLMPYFGRFAGQYILFELKRSSKTLVSIRVKVESTNDVHERALYRPLTTLYHTVTLSNGKGCDDQRAININGVRDKCIRFAHEALYPPEVEMQLAEISRDPPPLGFLCEKKILLHMGEINPSNLPYKYSHLKPQVAEFQDVFIQVWSSQDCSMLRMKVKPRTLIQELQWMVYNRILLTSNPANVEFYQADSLENLSPHSKLLPNQNVLHCIVKPVHEKSVVGMSFPLVVSVIGHGISQVMVNSTTTLDQFQKEVRSKFSLEPHSFIYFPAISNHPQGRVKSVNAVRMSAVLDGSTLALIDSKKAKLPIVNGIPSALVNYEQVPLYQMSIANLGLLNSAPVMAFEVTGPTIPLVYKTTQDQSNKDFAVVSEHSHAISVNPQWTVATLLKYVECVSGFPCKHLCLRDTTFPPEAMLKLHLTCRTWVMHAELVKDIPKITY